MDFQRLRIFCEVYRLRSYSQAARRLHLTQSAVSQQMRALERELTVELFESASRTFPTAAGDVLFKEAGLILAEIEDLRRGVLAAAGSGAGVVRLGMIDVAAVDLLPRALARFRREHPQIKVEAVVKTSGELLEMVERGELDVAVAVINRVPAVMSVRELRTDHIVAIVPRGSPLKRRELKLRDLRGQPLILYPGSSLTRQVIEEAFRARGIVPAVNMEMHYPAAICSMVRQGMGVGLLSELSAREHRLRGQEVVLIHELRGALKLGLVTHVRRRLAPQVHALMGAILAGKKNL
jgi:DNA-binding transcriptional LysR family regulator